MKLYHKKKKILIPLLIAMLCMLIWFPKALSAADNTTLVAGEGEETNTEKTTQTDDKDEDTDAGKTSHEEANPPENSQADDKGEETAPADSKEREAEAGETTPAVPNQPNSNTTVNSATPDETEAPTVESTTPTLSPPPLKPTLESITPSEGLTVGGMTVKLIGTDFVRGASVTIGGKGAVNPQFVSETEIKAETPAGRVGPKDVLVRNPSGQFDTLEGGFTYFTEFTIKGNVNFSDNTPAPAGLEVLVINRTRNWTERTETNEGNYQVTFTIEQPELVPLAGDEVNVMVRNDQRAETTYILDTKDIKAAMAVINVTIELLPEPLPQPALALTRITPNTGPIAGGTLVTITGTGFSNDITVTIGSVEVADIIEVSKTAIVVNTPEGVAGAQDVVVTRNDGQSETLVGAFTYRPKFSVPVWVYLVGGALIVVGLGVGLMFFLQHREGEGAEVVHKVKVRISKLILGNAQHIGAREEQEDAFGFSDPADTKFVAHSGVLAVVADGMGGLDLGRVASNTAVRTFLSAYEAKSAQEPIPQALHRALNAANSTVLTVATEAGAKDNVGTTLVAAVVHNDTLYWIAVGDSRLYLLRDRRLTLLTTDHTYGQTLAREVAHGRIRKEIADSDPDRHALTSFLGLEGLSEIESNAKPFHLQPGDHLLLCSDGLYGSLTESQMIHTLNGAPNSACEALVDAVLAKARPHQDNLTAVTLAYGPISE